MDLSCGLAERRTTSPVHGTGALKIEVFSASATDRLRAVRRSDSRRSRRADRVLVQMLSVLLHLDRRRRADPQQRLHPGCGIGTGGLACAVLRRLLDQVAKPCHTDRGGPVTSTSCLRRPSSSNPGKLRRPPGSSAPACERRVGHALRAHEGALSDFPFLDRIGGHDDDRLAEYAQAVMSASPWPE